MSGQALAQLQLSDIRAACERVRRLLPITPLIHSPNVSELIGHDVFFKWDNKLKTGSFKERGAVNFLLSLPEPQRSKGVCAASAGNHALALSYHAARLGIPCHIVMPTTAPLVKIQSTQKTGASVTLHGNTFDEALAQARILVEEKGLTLVHAFEDPRVIAGQGTIALEIIEQCPDLDSLIAPIGGGGLLAGTAVAIKALKPAVHILGVQSRWAIEMRKRLNQPCTEAIKPTSIADGIAIKVMGQLTQELITKFVDQTCVVDEPEIAQGIIGFLELERSVVEGGGAVGLSALLQDALPKKFKKTVVIVTGSNIDTNLLSRLIERDLGARGRMLRINVSVPDRPGSLQTTSGILANLGANVLQVYHDRSSSLLPGNVDIAFLLEVRNTEHKHEVIQGLEKVGLDVQEVLITHKRTF